MAVLEVSVVISTAMYNEDVNSYADDDYCHNHHDLGCGRDRGRGHVSQGVDDSTIGHEMAERTNIYWSVRDDCLRRLFLSCVV